MHEKERKKRIRIKKRIEDGIDGINGTDNLMAS